MLNLLILAAKDEMKYSKRGIRKQRGTRARLSWQTQTK
jgi:hypothetical protein